MNSSDVEVNIRTEDATEIATDLLVLKYMRNASGVGMQVANKLGVEDFFSSDTLPDIGDYKIFYNNIGDKLGAQNILYIGVEPAPGFRYQDIREFARRSLKIAGREVKNAEHITLTLHGPGYGLDEREAFEAELAGLMESIQDGTAPPELEQISIAEIDPKRANRLQNILDDFIPGRVIRRGQSTPDQARSVGYDSESKPHVFVAMPFDESFEDVYYLGIKESVPVDLLCERIDNESFTGNIEKEIKRRIESASLVVADMTTANPNVYLEVGFAWGKDVPTLLLTQDTDDLKFDVEHHNAIIYDRNKIWELRDELEETLTDLSIGPDHKP